MVDLTLYPSYKDLYQQSPLFARKKLIGVYQETQNKSLTARIFKTHLSVDSHRYQDQTTPPKLLL